MAVPAEGQVEKHQLFADSVVSGPPTRWGWAAALARGRPPSWRSRWARPSRARPAARTAAIVAALIDETMGLVIGMNGVLAFTAQLDITFRAPTPINVPHHRAGVAGEPTRTQDHHQGQRRGRRGPGRGSDRALHLTVDPQNSSITVASDELIGAWPMCTHPQRFRSSKVPDIDATFWCAQDPHDRHGRVDVGLLRSPVPSRPWRCWARGLVFAVVLCTSCARPRYPRRELLVGGGDGERLWNDVRRRRRTSGCASPTSSRPWASRSRWPSSSSRGTDSSARCRSTSTTSPARALLLGGGHGDLRPGYGDGRHDRGDPAPGLPHLGLLFVSPHLVPASAYRFLAAQRGRHVLDGLRPDPPARRIVRRLDGRLARCVGGLNWAPGNVALLLTAAIAVIVRSALSASQQSRGPQLRRRHYRAACPPSPSTTRWNCPASLAPDRLPTVPVA